MLSKYRAEFEEHVTAMWSSMNTLREVHDRMRLVETAEKLGIPVPETWLLNEVPDWNRELIVKSRYNILAEDYVDSLAPGECVVNKAVTYPEPGEEPDIETIRRKEEYTPIVQKVILDVPGVEYAFRALYDHGELVTMGQKRQARGETYAGGASVYRESIDDPRLEELGRTLLDSLEWHGLASVQFLKDADTGEFRLLEVNPRIWGSVVCDIRTGADFPYHYWLLAGDASTPIEYDYEAGYAIHYLFGELQYLMSVLRENYPDVEQPTFRATLWNVVSSCYTDPHFDYLSLMTLDRSFTAFEPHCPIGA